MSSEPFVAHPADLIDRAYWTRVLSDARVFHWSRATLRGGLLCLPAVAIWVALGPLHHHRLAGVSAVAGSVTAGFGAFQKLGQRRWLSMMVMLVGLAIANFLGSITQDVGWLADVLLLGTCAYLFGAMTMLGYATWWVGLQWMIGLIVLGGRPSPPAEAAFRALAVLAGGVSQLLLLTLTSRWTDAWFPTQDQPPLSVDGPIGQQLLKSLSLGRISGRYALRVAAAVTIASLVARQFRSPYGYWAPMTCVILLKPDFHEATLRGVNRLLGTLAGTGLVTLLIALVRPPAPIVAASLLCAVGGCFMLMRVNYALFVACISSYVVLLFALLGIPEPSVAADRVTATLIGAALSLLVWLVPLERRSFGLMPHFGRAP